MCIICGSDRQVYFGVILHPLKRCVLVHNADINVIAEGFINVAEKINLSIRHYISIHYMMGGDSVDCMGIAALSMTMSQTKIAMDVQTSLMKKALDAPGDLALELLDSMDAALAKTMEMSVTPYLGGFVDLKA